MIVHRGREYRRLHEGIMEKMHRMLETDMHILLASASSTGFLEGSIRCGVERKMVGISNGAFGERWQEIGEANGKEVTRLQVSWGRAVRGEMIEGHLTDKVEAVTLVTNESSTGVINPVHEIVEAIRKDHDPLIFLDGVTSVGAIDLRLNDLDIDALVFGTQKALALPPGLAMICVSDRLLSKAKGMDDRGLYFDLVRLKEFNDKGYAMTTPPISLLYALDFQLDRMLTEGMANRYARHREMADRVRGWAERCCGLYAEEGYRSNTITVVRNPGLEFADLQAGLQSRGYEISAGYGKLKGTTFRIGHMGDLTVGDVNELLSAIDEVMEVLR